MAHERSREADGPVQLNLNETAICKSIIVSLLPELEKEMGRKLKCMKVHLRTGASTKSSASPTKPAVFLGIDYHPTDQPVPGAVMTSTVGKGSPTVSAMLSRILKDIPSIEMRASEKYEYPVLFAIDYLEI